MIRPILACIDPYKAAEEFAAARWNVDFSQPAEQIQQLYENHLVLKPTELVVQPWGDKAFEVRIGGYQFMIAAPKQG